MSVRSWRSVGALFQNLQKLTVQRDSKFCRILDQTVLVNFSIKPEQIRYGLLLRHTYKFMAQHAWRFQMETITGVNSDVLEWYWKVFKVEQKIHFVNALDIYLYMTAIIQGYRYFHLVCITKAYNLLILVVMYRLIGCRN